MKNKLRIFTLALLFCLFSASAQAKTSISFWTTEIAPDRQAVIEYLIRAFQIHNRSIKVTVRGVEENKFAAELAAAHANGTAPDIISCSSDLMVAFSKKGWINCCGTQKVLDHVGKDNFFSGPLNKFRLADGKYCGLPFNGWVQGIWYRKDWFAKKGLPAPDSWENILNAARAFHDPQNGKYGILVGTRNDSYAEQVFTHLALSAGVTEFDKNGKVVFDSPETAATLKFYKQLSKYTPPGPQWWRGRDFYMQGRLAMMFYSTFIMDDLAIPAVAANSLSPDNFNELQGAEYDGMLLRNTGMVSSIKGTRKAAFGVIHALGLLKSENMKKQAAAVRFANFLYQDDAYITWLHMVPGGMLPMLKHIASTPAFYRDAQGVFQKYSRKRVKEIVSGFENIRSFSLIDGVLIPQAAQASEQGIISEMIDGTLQLDTPPAEAVSKAAAKMKAIND
ncbi:ABC transporter substrate-binding protein [Desulfovibrio sp. JC010]|uniref:ABC transporter substrate-binding protein n=1 Tax=Desulfovibrio sp. JC010 TaxID=2593641 RepID=UPI0013D3CFDA|nr:extracellular solute-binding protein [Desulfovibrio sp. JC010]NDV26865.1 extracellular solute-binding protein [Desulfovibrio sp. JC010]